MFGQRVQRAVNDAGFHRLPRCHLMQGLENSFEIVGAADAATGAAGQPAGAGLDLLRPLVGDRDLHLDASAHALDCHAQQLVRRCDQFLCDTETEREILQVLGRGHHHHMGHVVVHQHDRGLLDDAARGGRLQPVPPLDCLYFQQRAGMAEPAECGWGEGAFRRLRRRHEWNIRCGRRPMGTLPLDKRNSPSAALLSVVGIRSSS